MGADHGQLQAHYERGTAKLPCKRLLSVVGTLIAFTQQMSSCGEGTSTLISYSGSFCKRDSTDPGSDACDRCDTAGKSILRYSRTVVICFAKSLIHTFAFWFSLLSGSWVSSQLRLFVYRELRHTLLVSENSSHACAGDLDLVSIMLDDVASCLSHTREGLKLARRR
ncbi:hypothetical protein AAMO2058_000829400 [Amorphochlora amoebiformis]